MHDLPFPRQRSLEDADLACYAGELGLDSERLEWEVASGTHLTGSRRTSTPGPGAGSRGRRRPSSTASGTRTCTTRRHCSRRSRRPELTCRRARYGKSRLKYRLSIRPGLTLNELCSILNPQGAVLQNSRQVPLGIAGSPAGVRLPPRPPVTVRDEQLVPCSGH